MSGGVLAEVNSFRSEDDRRIVGLLTRPATAEPRALVVLPPAYERQIYHYGILARYLTDRGMAVLRFDCTDHVGASDGDIFDFTMSGMAADLSAVLAQVPESVVRLPRAVLAPSLAARTAVRALSRDSGSVAGIVLLLPAVALESTLCAVIGVNVIDEWRRGEVTNPRKPCRVVDHDVAYAYAEDALVNDWASLDHTTREMAALPFPVYAVAAERDDWVRVEDVRVALGDAVDHPRELLVIEATSHDVSHNPPVMRLLTEHVVRQVSQVVGLPSPRVEHLGFEDIVEIAALEKQWARSGYTEVEARGARA